MSEIFGGSLLAHAAGDGPVPVGACCILGFDGLLGCFGVETLFPLLVVLLIACIGVSVPGERYVLLACEYILYLLDVDIAGRGAVSKSDSCCNACCLAGTYALRDQVDVVDRYPVC